MATAAPDLDVVIVSYHSRDLVGRCLDSIAAATDGLDVTVTIADNAPGDGTAQVVAARHDGTQVLDMGGNVGFARANNRAMAAGTGRYVLVLNPDTVVSPEALRALVVFADGQPGVGVVAPRLRNADGTPQLTARAFPTPAAGLFGRRSVLTRLFPGNPWSQRFLTERSRPSAQPFESDWVSGAAMLVPRSVVAQTGGFDEDFFLYWEDADWCRRIRAAGYSVWTVPDALVVHDEGGSRSHGWSPRTHRFFHEGAYRYFTKHHAPQPWNPLRGIAFVLLTGRAGLLMAATTLRSRRSRTALLHPSIAGA